LVMPSPSSRAKGSRPRHGVAEVEDLPESGRPSCWRQPVRVLYDVTVFPATLSVPMRMALPCCGHRIRTSRCRPRCESS
jgi:hypothetical protein